MAHPDILGFGLIAPLRRDKKSDFAAAGGEVLVRSAVQQILGTVTASDFSQGELPWRTEFGSLLFILRQQKNDVALEELARVYVADAIRRWEPRVRVTTAKVTRPEEGGANQLTIRLRYNIIQQNVPGNNVIAEGVEQMIEL